MCTDEVGCKGFLSSTCFSPTPSPDSSPPQPGRVWRMDAAFNETFLPRGAQGSLKVAKGEEKNGVKKREGLESPGGGGD